MADDGKTGPTTPGAMFEFRGKQYYLPRVTQGEKDVQMARAAKRAMEIAKLIGAQMPPREAAALYAEARDMALAGCFHWDEPAGERARLTDDGVINVCFDCLKRHDPTVTLADVQAMAKERGVMFLFEQFQVANADPTRPQRAAGVVGDVSAPTSADTGASVPTSSAA